jgi:hypothetical protein
VAHPVLHNFPFFFHEIVKRQQLFSLYDRKEVPRKNRNIQCGLKVDKQNLTSDLHFKESGIMGDGDKDRIYQ